MDILEPTTAVLQKKAQATTKKSLLNPQPYRTRWVHLAWDATQAPDKKKPSAQQPPAPKSRHRPRTYLALGPGPWPRARGPGPTAPGPRPRARSTHPGLAPPTVGSRARSLHDLGELSEARRHSSVNWQLASLSIWGPFHGSRGRVQN